MRRLEIVHGDGRIGPCPQHGEIDRAELRLDLLHRHPAGLRIGDVEGNGENGTSERGELLR